MDRTRFQPSWWNDQLHGSAWRREKEHLKQHEPSSSSWDEAESPLAYGYAARSYYAASYPRWDDRLETELRVEWNRAHAEGDRFDDVKDTVRRGFDAPHV